MIRLHKKTASYSAPWATGLGALGYAQALYDRVFPEASRPRDRLGAHVHQHLWTRIVNRELLPGARFYEADIAAQTGVSRVPVREAVARLSDDGLLVRVGRGIQVRRFEAADVTALYNFRSVLESHAATIAVATLKEDVIAAALDRQHALDSQLAAPNPTYVVDYLVADLDLHGMIVGACGNQYLSDALHRLRGLLSLFQTDGMLREEDVRGSVTEHVHILKALAAHDGPGSAEAVRLHITNTRDRLIRALSSRSTGHRRPGKTAHAPVPVAEPAEGTKPTGRLHRASPLAGGRPPPQIAAHRE